MAESRYRIVGEIDAQTAAGAQKVKQDLRGVQNEARATEQALNRSFDQQKFDRTIGGLVTRLDQMEKKLGQAAGTSTQAGRSFDVTTGSIERMTAAEFRAAGGLEGLNQASKKTSVSQGQLEAALRRVLMAVDAGAAEQARLNALLADAKRLLDAGMISQERYAQVQQMVTNAGKGQTQMLGMQRIGYQQLGFQLGDVVTMWTLGAKPAQIFASQIGQVVQAVQLITGGTSKFASFLSGPWGIALTLAVIALSPFVGKLFEGNDALGDAIDKLRKDAQETDLSRRAKEAYNRTLDGQIQRLRELNAETDKQLKSQSQLRQEALATVRGEQATADKRLADLEGRIAQQRELVQKRQAVFDKLPYGEGRVLAGEDLAFAQSELQRLEKQLGSARTAATLARQAVRDALVPIAQQEAEAATDPLKAIEMRYSGLKDAITNTFRAGNMEFAQYRAELERLEVAQAAATEAAQKQKKATEDLGVAIFKSRQQAIGMAGQELQRAGLRVGENEQFGGVKGVHPGMGAAHGKYAIDVNEGTGIVEADVPDIRAKFDNLARRYQARGYRVLWNGWVYEANGDGPSRRIPGGQNQHRDHMHVEAPETIVGKATGASTEAQAMREETAQARVQERAEDFIQGIVNKAATVGLPSDAKTQLASDIKTAFAEFQRRFERAPDFFEKWQIATALTDADARAQSQHFDDAYVKPLERLEALQGQTGLSRAVLNKQLDEAQRLGRDLSPVEKELIENGVRRGDMMEREAELLQQIRGPMEEYRAQIEALNSLLAKGEISQTSYNARLAQMAQQATGSLAGMTGTDPATGQSFDQIAQRADEAARYALQLEAFQTHREELMRMGIDFDGLEEAARREHVARLADIDAARYDNARSLFGQLAQLQNSKVREIAAIGKAAAITQATIDAYLAINKALATLPPPFNIAMAAAIGATAFANVASIVGLRKGGYTGDVGENQIAGMVPVHGKEFVVNAEGTRKNRPLLEAINSGRTVREAGVAQGVAAAAPSVTVAPGPPPEVNLRVINVDDMSKVGAYLATPEGEQAFVNALSRQPELIARLASGQG